MPQSQARNGSNYARSHREANGSSEAERHIQQIQNFAAIEFKHGKTLLARGEFTQAITHLQKASVLVNHRNPTYLTELAQAHEQADNLDKAYETYSQAIWLKPPQIVAIFFQRGLIAARQNKGELAADDFGRVINTFVGTAPSQPEAQKQLVSALYHRGLVHRQRGKIQEAIDDIKQAVEFDPHHAEAHFDLGELYSKNGEHKLAGEFFERALQIVETFEDACIARRRYTFHRGLCWLAQGKHGRAIEDFSVVLSTSTTSRITNDELALDSLFYRGKAHLAEQSLTEAIADFSKVLAVDGQHIEAFRLRSEAYAANGQLEQSESDVKDVLNRKPDFAKSFFDRALTRLSSPQEAIDDLSEAIRLQADFSAAYYHRGLLRQRIATEIEAAIADFKHALSCRPDHEFARYQLGKTYELAGKHKMAIDQYTQMLNDGLSKYPFVYIARARCYRELGDRTQATSDLRKAKRLEAGVR